MACEVLHSLVLPLSASLLPPPPCSPASAGLLWPPLPHTSHHETQPDLWALDLLFYPLETHFLVVFHFIWVYTQMSVYKVLADHSISNSIAIIQSPFSALFLQHLLYSHCYILIHWFPLFLPSLENKAQGWYARGYSINIRNCFWPRGGAQWILLTGQPER